MTNSTVTEHSNDTADADIKTTVAGMPDDARGRPVWYLAVAHLECLGQTVGEVTEARPQDNRHLGSAETTSAQELRGLDRFVELGQRASHRITESLTPRRR